MGCNVAAARQHDIPPGFSALLSASTIRRKLHGPQLNLDGSVDWIALAVDYYTGEIYHEWRRTWSPITDADWQEAKRMEERQVARLRQTHPFFEMRAMIDTLYHYAHPAQDLTEMQQDIPLADNLMLCLDLPGANPTPGKQVQLYRCNWTGAQQWVYDRKNFTVRNTATKLWLDVANGSLVRDTPVVSWNCHGGRNQKWTWDPESGILESATGMVLDAYNPQTGTQLVTRDRQGAYAGSQGFYGSGCPHDICTAGSTMPYCDPCVTAVSAADPYCNEIAWDDVCIGEIEQFCGGRC